MPDPLEPIVDLAESLADLGAAFDEQYLTELEELAGLEAVVIDDPASEDAFGQGGEQEDTP